MRIWHKELIEVLPRQQLIGQWRECCCIARNVELNGTPNHLLINKVMEYPVEHFISYAERVAHECWKRGYMVDWNRLEKWLPPFYDEEFEIPFDELFKGWHNHRYFEQCYYNLQEKYDCGGITSEDYEKIAMKRIRHLEGMLFKEK